MRKVGLPLAALMAVGVLVASPVTIAASPSQEQCEAQGGTFQRSRGQVECVIVDEGKNPKFTDTTSTTGQGNIGNKQEETSARGGTGSGKCPPGQF
jgi:hypothetical protein